MPGELAIDCITDDARKVLVASLDTMLADAAKAKEAGAPASGAIASIEQAEALIRGLRDEVLAADLCAEQGEEAPVIQEAAAAALLEE